MPNTKKLEAGLDNRHVQMMAIGGAIGTGLFLGAGKSIHLAGPSILFAYLITGIICFFIMRALGELLLSNLNHSSFIGFIRQYFGERWAFVTSWTYWFCWASIAMADLTAVGIYMQYWFPSVEQWVPGLIALLLLMVLNLTTVKLFGEIEFWFALIKVVAIVALIAVGVYLLAIGFQTSSGAVTLANLYNNGGMFPNGIYGFILAFQMVVFAFVGIELVGITIAETKNPMITIPKAINNIPLRIILFYIGALVVIMSIYPWNTVDPKSSPFVAIFTIIGVASAAGLVNFVVLTSAASACNSGVYSTSRIVYHMARRHDAPKTFRKLTKNNVPSHALYFSSLVIFVAVILNYIMPEGVFTLITSISTSCFIFIWGIIVLCHLKYRKQLPKDKKPYFAMPFFPIMNYLILAFLFFVVIVLLLAEDTRIALIVTPIWFIALLIIFQFKGKAPQEQTVTNNTQN